MKIVFFGTPVFAAVLLEHLIENRIDIPLIVTRKDKPKGRNLELAKSPVKQLAEKYGLPCYQPEKASDEEAMLKLKGIEADLFVVAAFGEILKQAILDLPRLASINVHTSLLPKYRGAAPIQRVIMDGETKTGISIMHMVKKMDAGEIICQKEVDILQNDTFGVLEEKLLDAAKPLLLETIRGFEIGTPKAKPQDESFATYAPKVELEDCKIDWSKDALEIHNLVRGVNPYPGAWTEMKIDDKIIPLKIWETRVIEKEQTMSPSLKIEDRKIFVSKGAGVIEVVELQLPGKKRMPAAEWLKGARFQTIEFI